MTDVPPVATSPATTLNGLASRHRPAPERPVAITLNPVDVIEISPEAIEAEHQQHEGKVQRIRAALADGTYLHPDKMDAALDRLLDSLDS